MMRWADILEMASFVSAEEVFLDDGEVIGNPADVVHLGVTKLWERWRGRRRHENGDYPTMIGDDGMMSWARLSRSVRRVDNMPMKVYGDGSVKMAVSVLHPDGTVSSELKTESVDSVVETRFSGVVYSVPLWMVEADHSALEKTVYASEDLDEEV